MHLKYNYHTHTELCNHAGGMPIDYINMAISLGMKQLGFSDHNYVPSSFFPESERHKTPNNMSYDEFINVYLVEIAKCKKKYAEQIKIYAGLECEYFPQEYDYYKGLLDKLDYLIFGQHFFLHDGKILNSYCDLDYSNIKDYAQNACLAMKSGLFKVFAHPDVFMMSYKDINGKRVFDEEAAKASKMMIECAIENDVVLELNINGVGNSKRIDPVNWAYPNEHFWKIVNEYKDAKIIMGVDAHSPEAMDSEYLKPVIEFIDRLGLKVLKKLEI